MTTVKKERTKSRVKKAVPELNTESETIKQEEALRLRKALLQFIRNEQQKVN